jgi:hypothetical protein
MFEWFKIFIITHITGVFILFAGCLFLYFLVRFIEGGF